MRGIVTGLAGAFRGARPSETSSAIRGLIRTIAAAAAVVTVLLLAGTGGQAAGSRHAYWANHGPIGISTIGRATVDGSGAEQSFITGASSPLGVAVDSGHIYWANQGTGTIGRANLDGTGVNESFITGATFAEGVAVDAG